MNAALRRTHVRTWAILGPALLLALLTALWLRPRPAIRPLIESPKGVEPSP